MSVVELLRELSMLGVRAFCPEPGCVRLVATTGDVPAEAVALAKAGKPELVEHFAATSIRCPWCRGTNLIDDPAGIGCVDCNDLAFIEVSGSIIRADFVEPDFIEVVARDVPTCDRCGKLCDVQTIDHAWHCAACDPVADQRRRRTEKLLQHIAAIRR